MIPKELLEIRDYLVTIGFQVSRGNGDGRLMSAINEDELLKAISLKFDIDLPPPRHWYDFAVKRGTEKIPVNIKVTSTSTADNVQCKLGMFYALTGIWPSFANETPWKEYFSLLKRGLGTRTDKDYYILVVSKKTPNDVFCTSLKQVQSLVANGNNLPFQCNWGANRVLADRTHAEAVRFLLGKFYESIKLRANICDEFEEHFGNIV